MKKVQKIAYFHLPGLFEFYDLYKIFLPLFYQHRDYFYNWCEIGSIYGAPADCLWGGGRVGFGENNPQDVLNLLREYGISARLTFSNSLLKQEHLSDKKCNTLCRNFASSARGTNGVIVHSDLLADYLKANYPQLHLVSSTTKCLTTFEEFKTELNRDNFLYVVPDFRLNKQLSNLSTLSPDQKDKVEFLCNECCSPKCQQRKICYEIVSRKSLGEKCQDFRCKSAVGNEGYRFSQAKKNPQFISINDITNVYLPMGFVNFKIEGRSLGSALILEFLLYYLTKPEYELNVREAVYLDNMLDLF